MEYKSRYVHRKRSPRRLLFVISGSIRYRSQVLLLYIYHLLLFRPLNVSGIYVVSGLVQRGNRHWIELKVRGCVKVKVNNNICFAGNVSNIPFVVTERSNQISLQFFGVFGREERYLVLESQEVKIKDGFQLKTSLPLVEVITGLGPCRVQHWANSVEVDFFASFKSLDGITIPDFTPAKK